MSASESDGALFLSHSMLMSIHHYNNNAPKQSHFTIHKPCLCNENVVYFVWLLFNLIYCAEISIRLVEYKLNEGA